MGDEAKARVAETPNEDPRPASSNDDTVGLPPTTKTALSQILSHAASQDRTVVEFRTTETDEGVAHLSHALDITDYVEELEEAVDEVPEK